MFSLANGALEVQILDPVADRGRFGVRYCTGGYIFQVRDPRHRDLLSGPTYPESFNWFDGQGIPDAFNLGPLNSNKTLGEALVIGIGVCDMRGRTVTSFCDWTVERDASSAVFTTRQSYEDFSLTLARSVLLHERTIRSHTVLANVGKAPIPMRWFPHPFYPQTTTDELLWVNVPLRWRDANGYTQARSGFIARAGWPWNEGKYLPLDHDATAPLVLLQRHPMLGIVTAACSYVPDFFPIWGNAVTFSWEPFLERTIAPGAQLTWWIDYTF
jgi:hypothetical protein